MGGKTIKNQENLHFGGALLKRAYQEKCAVENGRIEI